MKLSFSKWYSIDHFKGWLENIRWGTQPSSPSGVPSVLPTFRSTGTPSHGRYKFSWKYKSLTGLWCMYLPTTHFYWRIGNQIKTIFTPQSPTLVPVPACSCLPLPGSKDGCKATFAIHLSLSSSNICSYLHGNIQSIKCGVNCILLYTILWILKYIFCHFKSKWTE